MTLGNAILDDLASVATGIRDVDQQITTTFVGMQILISPRPGL